jgi:hypothetical protein
MSIRYSVRYVLQGRYQGLSLFDAAFDLTWLTCLSSENGHLPGTLRSPVQITYETLMREAGIPPKLMDERMGHEDGSVQSRYDHITLGMRQALMVALTEMWEKALDERRATSPGSPVAVLDALLKARE